MAEQLIEQEAGAIGLDARDAVLDDVLLEVPGIGVLEELFRDEAVAEFMVLSYDQIIRRAGEGWLPASVQFRDAEQLRRTLKKLFETSLPIGDVPTTSDGAADAILANGFRMLAVIPPRVMDASPMAVFRRPLPAVSAPTPAPQSGTVRLTDHGGAVSFNLKTPIGSGPMSAALSQRMPDPWEKLRQRVTERFIERLAANGVFDISAIPLAELRRVVAQYVVEFNDGERLQLDAAVQERLTLDILTHMQR